MEESLSGVLLCVELHHGHFRDANIDDLDRLLGGKQSINIHPESVVNQEDLVLDVVGDTEVVGVFEHLHLFLIFSESDRGQDLPINNLVQAA